MAVPDFVVDCSFTMAWVFRDEATNFSLELRRSLGQGAKACVPALWRWEVANVLLSSERSKRILAADASQHLSLLASLPIEVDDTAFAQAWGATHLLARKHKLTSYDAAYLELAQRRGLPLASHDDELRAAAKAEKIKILPEKR
jgi:predicted nucleic acid-binding protein